MISQIPSTLICDVIVGLFFLGFAVMGYRKGFAQIFVGAFSCLIALILAFILQPYATKGLEAIGLTAKIAEGIGKGLHLDTLFGGISAGIGEGQNIIANLPIPHSIKEGLLANNTAQAYLELGAQSLTEYISLYLARIAVNTISLLLVFVVSLILLRLITKQLKWLNKIPVIGFINEVLGIASGLVIAVCILALVVSVLTALAVAYPETASLVEILHGSLISGWLIENGYGLTWAKKLLDQSNLIQ